MESAAVLRFALMIVSKRLWWMWWVCNNGYLICFLICLIFTVGSNQKVVISNGCSNACKLSPMDSISNIGAIMDSSAQWTVLVILAPLGFT